MIQLQLSTKGNDNMVNNLKNIRQSAGLTQKELAEKSGIPQNKISLYECTDISNKSVSILYRLAEALNVTINDIVYPHK